MRDDTSDAIAADVQAIGRIEAVPSLLRTVCEITGMRFAAVARVTDGTWTACAVHDLIAFGLLPGSQLDVHTTLCKEARQARAPVVIDNASTDPVYAGHHTPRIYGIESYISVPIVLPNDEYFGNLCAIDPRPAQVSAPHIVTLFTLFAGLIASQLEIERQRAVEQQALARERAAGELREQFMAILSHDLRNPLNAAAMSAHLLKAKSASAEARGWADAILRNVGRMATLIDDMLDLTRSRLGSGLDLRLAPVADLGRALGDVAAELAAAHPARTIDTAIDIGGVVRCDAARVQQLVSNLLANALTHGAPDTPVRLEAHVDGDTLVVTVRNQGVPIAPGMLERLFEPFQRGRAAGEGLGLGLYICSQIAQAHGGTLSAQSSTDGTVFTARLPAASPDSTPGTDPARRTRAAT